MPCVWSKSVREVLRMRSGKGRSGGSQPDHGQEDHHRLRSYLGDPPEPAPPSREGSVLVEEVFGPGDFQTGFESLRLFRIPPATSLELGSSDRVEHCLIPVDGAMRVEVPGARTDIQERTIALCRGDRNCSVLNLSKDPSALLVATVRHRDGTDDSSRDGHVLSSERLDRSRLGPFEAHLGMGTIGFRTLFDRRASAWNSVDHVMLPPRTSVGYHRNHNVEEVFVIVEGVGRMKIEDSVVGVTTGDCIRNPPGGTHGIVNTGATPLELLNLSVAAGDDQSEVTDLGDDLGDLISDTH
jgi:mannose-6-phosphate isomerase-like protein (cupin superfamily)